MEKLSFSGDKNLYDLVGIEFDENLFIHLDNDQVEDIKLNYMSPRFAEKLELSRPFDR